MEPLQGIKVVEWPTSPDGTWVASMLADLGAAVVRVEPPEGGRYRRCGRPGTPDWVEPAACTRAERRAAFGLGADRDFLEVLALVEDADVFLSDRRPGLGERMGIGDNALEANNRGLIRCWLRGADTMTALIAVQAILAALYAREQTGRGERIDVAMADVMAFVEAPDARYRGSARLGAPPWVGAIDRCPARPTGRAGGMVSSLHRRKNDN